MIKKEDLHHLKYTFLEPILSFQYKIIAGRVIIPDPTTCFLLTNSFRSSPPYKFHAFLWFEVDWSYWLPKPDDFLDKLRPNSKDSTLFSYDMKWLQSPLMFSSSYTHSKHFYSFYLLNYYLWSGWSLIETFTFRNLYWPF